MSRTDVLTTLTTREACIVAEFRLEDIAMDLTNLQVKLGNRKEGAAYYAEQTRKLASELSSLAYLFDEVARVEKTIEEGEG